MDIYKSTFDLLFDLFPAQEWPDARAILERAQPKKPRDWRLPVLACEAVGGSCIKAVPAAAAIGCMQISIILVDDLLDNDPRGEYHCIGAPATANLAIAFQAAGMDAIAQSDVGAVTKLAAFHSLNQMMLTTAYGQYLDTQNTEDEAAYWNLVRTKSSPFFGSALHIGALLGGASADVATQIKQFGHLYGEMIQIHDDLNDTMDVPANPDWTLGRLPLPILFAQIVDHPGKARFIELREVITNPDALTEAQEILVRCGAVSYCIDQLVRRYQSAIDILSTLPLITPDLFEGLLDDVIIPVMNLFSAIGVDEPEALLQTHSLVV